MSLSGLVFGDVDFDVLWQQDALCIEDYPVVATLAWRVEMHGLEAVEVRVDAPDGGLLATAGPSGSTETGDWVRETTEFFLVARPGGEVLATASLETPSCSRLRRAEQRQRVLALLAESPAQAVQFDLSPPRLFYCGQPIERTAIGLSWNVSALEASRVELFLESADGPVFAAGAAIGQTVTRDWVIDGTVFVLYLPEFDVVAATREFRIRPCAEANQ